MNRSESASFSIKPYFPGRNAIVFTLDRGYLKQLAVMLRSIVDFSSSENLYDLIVIESGFSEDDRCALKDMCSQNMHIRFIDISPYINEQFPQIKLQTRSYWSEAMWYKCFIPFIMDQYQKVCYLDVDAIVQYDINNIFSLKVSNAPLVGVRDVISYMIDQPAKSNDRRFFANLGILQPHNYFNAGMLLFNISAFDIEQYRIDFLRIIASGVEFKCPEQDVLNSIFNECIELLPFKYNYQIYPNQDDDFKKNFELIEGGAINQAGLSPLFIHYFGAIKPWHQPDSNTEFFSLFWSYAKRTPFYEQLVNESRRNAEQLGYMARHKKSMRFAYCKAKLLSMLTFGETKAKYEAERRKIKNQLIKIKNL